MKKEKLSNKILKESKEVNEKDITNKQIKNAIIHQLKRHGYCRDC